MINELLALGPVVVNIGLESFAEALQEQQVPVIHVRWRPPPALAPEVARVLEALQ